MKQSQKTNTPVVKPYTADELRAMLAVLEPKGVPIDSTIDLSLDGLPPHAVADKSQLPPVDERKVSQGAQLPAAIHGKFDINGITMIAPGVPVSANINPATGGFYTQVGPRPATQISPPPSRRFDGR